MKTKKSTFYFKMAIHIHKINLHLSFFLILKIKKDDSNTIKGLELSRTKQSIAPFKKKLKNTLTLNIFTLKLKGVECRVNNLFKYTNSQLV